MYFVLKVPFCSVIGSWKEVAEGKTQRRASDENGASFEYRFNGNQVRLIGGVGPDGGIADVYLDGGQKPLKITDMEAGAAPICKRSMTPNPKI